MSKSNSNTKQMFTFNTTPPTARESVRRVLGDDDCRNDVMQAIHGDAGSRAFNQAAAVREFLLHDLLNGAVITNRMDTGELNHRQVWLHMAAAIKTIEKQYQRLMLEMEK